jgi:hypothetical protein
MILHPLTLCVCKVPAVEHCTRNGLFGLPHKAQEWKKCQAVGPNLHTSVWQVPKAGAQGICRAPHVPSREPNSYRRMPGRLIEPCRETVASSLHVNRQTAPISSILKVRLPTSITEMLVLVRSSPPFQCRCRLQRSRTNSVVIYGTKSAGPSTPPRSYNTLLAHLAHSQDVAFSSRSTRENFPSSKKICL